VKDFVAKKVAPFVLKPGVRAVVIFLFLAAAVYSGTQVHCCF
jgi:hypothetical protein